jgi:hypothetical protein
MNYFDNSFAFYCSTVTIPVFVVITMLDLLVINYPETWSFYREGKPPSCFEVEAAKGNFIPLIIAKLQISLASGVTVAFMLSMGSFFKSF